MGEPDMTQPKRASATFPAGKFDMGEIITADNVTMLMHILAHTEEDEYSCAETFALLDEYVETAVKNEADAALVMPLVKHHLDVCPDCHKEFEALLRILETDYSS